ncbi:MAG: leucine-rich repeat protein, partial [Bacteroidales bacterium]|nr:leucine-rich repeat protein [Bacteroidales bacterium]
MKRIFTILFWLSVAVNVVGQEKITVDGFLYQILNENEVSLIGAETTGFSGDWIFPATIKYQRITYNVVSIGKQAFNPSGLYVKNITIPNSVTTIEDGAFGHCQNLESITIPSSVTSIGTGNTGDCFHLYSIIIDSDNPVYDSRNNCNAIIETATNTLISGCRTTVIPNGITAIADHAFDAQSTMQSVTIPDGVLSIGDKAFSGCKLLTSIEIPRSVKTIGANAFDACVKLSSITLSDGLISIGDKAFKECNSLTSVTIPSSVTSISGTIFMQCPALTTIKVADGNTVYDSRNNCNAIVETATNTLVRGCKNTIIPNTITSLGDGAFCYSPIVSINIPNSVVEIGQSAFEGCSQLLSISIPASVTSINKSAFQGCSALTSVIIPENVVTIGENAFFSCKSLFSFSIPHATTSIGNYAFHNTGLTSIFIPASVNSMGENPFARCSALNSIKVAEDNPVYDSRNNCNAIIETSTNTLKSGCTNTKVPYSVVRIGNRAFEGCSITSIQLPNKITSIDINAFEDCSNLTSILLPENMVSIGNSAFIGCSKLTQFICSAKNPPKVNTNAIIQFSSLYVLCDSYDAYKNHEVWGRFENIECRSLNALDMEDVAINDGEALPIIDLSEYFSSDDGEIKFSAKSSDNRVVYPALMGNKLGFIQYGTGSAEITVTAMVEPLSRSRSFTLSINTETQPQDCELTLSAKIIQPKCYGSEDGKITVSVSGGSEPYYYKWSNGRTDGTLSGVSAGTYSVLVADENGCTAEKSFTIAETDSIVITEKLTKPTCRKSNGKITLNITGGTEPYTYLWNLPKNRIDVAKDLENLQSESYIITVTDKNSCKASKIINLPDNGAPTVKLKSVEPSKCLEATGSIEVEVSGGSSYSWSDSANVNKLIRPKLFPGNYTFKVSDNNGCRATMLVTVPMQQ